MFKVLKKNKNSIVAPVTGKIISLEEVEDVVFSSGMMGEGIAIQPQDCLYVAPCDGEIILIPETKHAFGIRTDDNLELLVHIGLDTALKKGKGFEVLVNVGERVKKGTPIIRVDIEYFKKEKISLDTPIIITKNNEKKINMIMSGESICGDTVIMKY